MNVASSEKFLHTTHRTVSWFNKAFLAGDLELSPPFQRNAVWTTLQKAFLIDTILSGLPIPELYMQDVGSEDGREKHVVVDGQQRIRAVLEFLQGEYSLEGENIAKKWLDLKFSDLDLEDKKEVYSYKFVVRILPELDDVGIRQIFARLNRNVVALTDQELRNATYLGPFIKSIQKMADDDPFWARSGIFSANDHRRMLDHEYISELAIAFLHGPQNKKEKLDEFYRLHEQTFEDQEVLIETFRKVALEIDQVVPTLSGTRWRKKSDFYTLFLAICARSGSVPWPSDYRDLVSSRIIAFGEQVDRVLRLEEDERQESDPSVVEYARAVARAASDKAARIVRSSSFEAFVFQSPKSASADMEIEGDVAGQSAELSPAVV